MNVRINTPGLEDKRVASELIANIETLENRGTELQAQIQAQLIHRGGFAPE